MSNKNGDQSLNFEGFLRGLQDYDKTSPKVKSKAESVTEKKQPVSNSASKLKSSSTGQYRSAMDYDTLSKVSSSFLTEDSTVDAVSEKDQGNEYFKRKKFNEAIDCYSRSIALSPTAVAYANRAMAYLKIKRYQEAEEDCTEALNLDDRYIKAYARRATARKELGKLRDSLEDVEFALRLEPKDEDLKKQRAEVKTLLEKAILAKAAGTTKRPVQRMQEVESIVDHEKDNRAPSVSSESKRSGVGLLPGSKQVSTKESAVSGNTVAKNKTRNGRQQNGLGKAAPESLHEKNDKASKDLDTSIHELASRAASRAAAEAARNIVTPKSAYQFEVAWRGLSGDRSLQSRLLKVTPPDELPQIFKNALTAPLLVDIIKCLATLFTEEMELVVKYLENLTKVSRFAMIIMCLPSADKAELQKTWNEVFLSKATPIEVAELVSELHPKYFPWL